MDLVNKLECNEVMEKQAAIKWSEAGLHGLLCRNSYDLLSENTGFRKVYIICHYLYRFKAMYMCTHTYIHIYVHSASVRIEKVGIR